jgi:hypothetical protein
MKQTNAMHDQGTERLILQLHFQALVGERLSNGDTNQPGGGVIHKVLDLLPTHFNRLRLLRDAQNLHLRPLEFPNTVLAVTLSLEHALLVLKRPLQRRRFLINRDTVVEVQRPTRRPVSRWRNHQLEVLFPQVGRRVCTLDAQWKHNSALYVHRDLCVRDICQADIRRLSFHRLVCEEIVEPVIGEIDVDRSRVFFKNWTDENAWTEEKLELDVVCLRILGVLEEQRLESGCSVRVLFVKGRVEVVEQAIAHVDGVFRCLGDQRPAVEFLRDRSIAVMVAVEWIECSEHSPPGA